MSAYQFETVVPGNGVISLPETYKDIYNHRVQLTLVDLEEHQEGTVSLFCQIVQEFAETNEPDLDLEEIYLHRSLVNERKIVFD